MSSETAATHLARLKVQFRDWSIRAIEPGNGVGFTAKRTTAHGGVRSLYAPTLGELEAALAELASGRRREER